MVKKSAESHNWPRALEDEVGTKGSYSNLAVATEQGHGQR